MRAVQTKMKVADAFEINGKFIAAIVAIPEKGKLRLYVAWEWFAPANNGVYAFCKSKELYKSASVENINQTMNYGTDIGGTTEGKKIFKSIL